MKNTVNRRQFMKASAGVGLALGTPIFGFQDAQFRIALIGSGWWGMNILRCAIEAGRCRVVGLCDPDRNQLVPASEEVGRLTGGRPNRYSDYRELLAAEEPDIVIVATPDHWHPLITIAAVEAGAHVYVEKPIGHTIKEGRAMVEAARRNDRMVQVGTHRRVSPHNISGIEFLKSGKVGQIGMVKSFVYNSGGVGQPTPDSEPPDGLDWEMWCGPAPLRPFNKRIHPKGFRQFLEYANGTLGDWGIHWLDQVLWWTEEKYPKKVFSTGGRHIALDSTDAPDTQVATFEFESFTATWEHRRYGGHPNQDHQVGCFFYGTKGVFHMGWLDGWTFYPNAKGQAPIHQEPKLHSPDSQNIPELWADFIESIDQGRLPVCDIETGHRSTNMSLLGMLSLKCGRAVEWDGEREQVVKDNEANRLLSREYRRPWVYPGV
jgi:predicted dehydrogenase